jgi:hypothetical protein
VLFCPLSHRPKDRFQSLLQKPRHYALGVVDCHENCQASASFILTKKGGLAGTLYRKQQG